MAVATFGNFAVDLTDPSFFDNLFGSDFSGEPSPQSSTPTQLVAIFPSGAKVIFNGSFTFDPAGRVVPSSTINEIIFDQPGDQLALDVNGITGFTAGAATSVDRVLNLLDAQVTEVVTQGFNDIIEGDDRNEIAHAGGGDDIIRGNGGNDVLDGQAGADQMFGGTGNDTYFVDDPGDQVNELLAQGIDLVHAAIAYTLPANVEQLILDGSVASGTGNALDNVITGNDSANTLDGGDGNDKLNGLAGNDILIGGSGNDSLEGGAGADAMTGGSGDDNYVIDNAGDTVIEAQDGGFDTEQSSVDRSIDANVEQLILVGGAQNATGDGRANSLNGNSGNNVLDGGRGPDIMAGAAGDDTYKVDSSLDQVSENAGQGTDTVISQVSEILPANIENLTLAQSGGDLEGTGNSANNVIIGNDAANLLDGAAGNDTLKGQGGADTLLGGDGNDTLSGGAGRDLLIGGAGADHFVFDSPIISGNNVDQILDFVKGQDVIDLSAAIFTQAGAPGNLDPSGFVSDPGAVAHNASQHIVHDTTTGLLYYDADGSGAQQMVAFAQVNPGQALTASDIHVVA